MRRKLTPDAQSTFSDGDAWSSRGSCNVTPGTLRILDAAANRAREGIRLLEDFVHFICDDRRLTGHLKQLRLDLTSTLLRLPGESILACREPEAEVGAKLSTDAAFERADIDALVAANFKRLQEALRALEEFGKTLDKTLDKTIDPEFSSEIEQLRSRSYTLERAVDATKRNNDRLAGVRLYVLIDGRESADAFETLAQQLIEAGVHALQLRDKKLNDRELLARARLLRHLTQDAETLFIMNDRPDLAALAHADGVHIGQEELAVNDVRRVVGPRMLIGVSTHSLEQAGQAVLDGADYLGLGPTFPSGTKRFDDFPGLEFLRQVRQEIQLPAFAIGGITGKNLQQVLATGIRRVAVSGAILGCKDPIAAVREILNMLR